MLLKVKLDENACMPTKAHKTDAGFDIYCREDTVIEARCSACFDTGVHIEIPAGFVGFLKSKSGLNVKHGIQGEGVIDAGYTGSIVVKLYNNSDKEYKFNKGDKISQIVFLPIPDIELNEIKSTEQLSVSDRGDDGFGSSGK